MHGSKRNAGQQRVLHIYTYILANKRTGHETQNALKCLRIVY